MPGAALLEIGHQHNVSDARFLRNGEISPRSFAGHGMPCPYETEGFGGDFRATCHHSAAPAITETTLAACAFVNPRNDRGLMRMNSTKNLATPVRIRYAAKTLHGAYIIFHEKKLSNGMV